MTDISVAPSAQEAGRVKFSVWTLSAPRSLEGVNAPVDGPLHGRRARDSTTHLVRQAMQIGFQGRWLKCFADNPVRGILRQSATQGNGEEKKKA